MTTPAFAQTAGDDALRTSCRTSAAEKLGVVESLAVLDGTGEVVRHEEGFVIRGNADLGNAGIKHFTCHFGADRALARIDLADPAPPAD